jgi:hypothetical protein
LSPPNPNRYQPPERSTLDESTAARDGVFLLAGELAALVFLGNADLALYLVAHRAQAGRFGLALVGIQVELLVGIKPQVANDGLERVVVDPCLG